LLHEVWLDWHTSSIKGDVLEDEDDFRRGLDLWNRVQLSADNDRRG
jgi:hypothetical protein